MARCLPLGVKVHEWSSIEVQVVLVMSNVVCAWGAAPDVWGCVGGEVPAEEGDGDTWVDGNNILSRLVASSPMSFACFGDNPSKWYTGSHRRQNYIRRHCLGSTQMAPLRGIRVAPSLHIGMWKDQSSVEAVVYLKQDRVLKRFRK